MIYRLINADAMDGLRMLGDERVDATITDPPYGEGVASWDVGIDRAFHVRWITEASRVTRGPIIAFGGRRRFDLLMGAMRDVRGDSPECPLQMGAWVHRQGFVHTPGHLRPEHEPFVVSGLLNVESEDVRTARQYQTAHNIARNPTHRGEASGMRHGLKAHTYIPHEDGPVGGTTFDCSRNKFSEATGHPSQKPLALMRYLVALASTEGQTVLDPFSGSGSTGEAALTLRRSFIGIERDAGYFAASRERLSKVAPMFAREESQIDERRSVQA